MDEERRTTINLPYILYKSSTISYIVFINNTGFFGSYRVMKIHSSFFYSGPMIFAKTTKMKTNKDGYKAYMKNGNVIILVYKH